ncbi:hypothetical protein HDV05_004183 [Chytridiales sp. JEL 0842]|nr:hypothetical protein HDV05_004183 [Chytridiales sp. JEL 0842]
MTSKATTTTPPALPYRPDPHQQQQQQVQIRYDQPHRYSFTSTAADISNPPTNSFTPSHHQPPSLNTPPAPPNSSIPPNTTPFQPSSTPSPDNPPSGSWFSQPLHPSLYPLAGILYFFTQPKLWKEVICRLLLMILLNVAVTLFLFIYAFPRQAWLLEGWFRGGWTWAAWVVAFFLVIFELALAVVLFASLLLPLTFDTLFASVLRLKNQSHLFTSHPLTHSHRRLPFVLAHQKLASKMVQILDTAVQFLTLPLHFFPFVGTAAYITLNGFLSGFSSHWYYFALKKLTFEEAWKYARRRKAGYAAFGASATVLGGVPVLNALFVFTNVVGAALWAADLESGGRGPVKVEEEGVRGVETLTASGSTEALLEGGLGQGHQGGSGEVNGSSSQPQLVQLPQLGQEHGQKQKKKKWLSA